MSAELQETRTLVRLIESTVLKNFRETITAGTGDEATAQKAVTRVEEALIECLRKATEELVRPSAPTDPNALFLIGAR